MQQMDSLYGHVYARTAAATDSYSEAQVSFPQTSLSGGSKRVLVPLVKTVELEIPENISTVSADFLLRAQVYNSDAVNMSAIAAAGIADLAMICTWTVSGALTTSGQPLVLQNYRWDAPGDGMLLCNPYITIIQHNVATGVSMTLACRVWYEFVDMDLTSYLYALHGY